MFPLPGPRGPMAFTYRGVLCVFRMPRWYESAVSCGCRAAVGEGEAAWGPGESPGPELGSRAGRPTL